MKTCENCIYNRGCIDSANYRSAETCEKYEKGCDGGCYSCNCWDSDREGCTMPSADIIYACDMKEDEK